MAQPKRRRSDRALRPMFKRSPGRPGVAQRENRRRFWAAIATGVSSEEAEVYAEGLRRGGAVVSAKVADADAARLQDVMDRSSVRIGDRATAYRKAGWKSFDPAAGPYTPEQVRRERDLYR